MSLPTHPTLSPILCGSAKKTGPAPRSLWVGLWVEIRGGSDAPAAEDVDPNAVDVCPRGDVAPPSWRFAVEKRRRASAGAGCSAKGTSVSAATVTAIAPTRERTVVLSGVKVSRASRAARRLGTRDLDTASARPVNGNCRIESEPRT